MAQRIAGDTALAKAYAEQARNTLESLKKDQPDNAFIAAALAVAYAMLDEKDLALNEAQRATTLLPSNKDRLSGPAFEENLALVEMIIGENTRAIATLTRLLQTPYGGWLYSPTPITPALLRLDPIWDPLRRIRFSKNFARKSSRKSARSRRLCFPVAALAALENFGPTRLCYFLQRPFLQPTWLSSRQQVEHGVPVRDSVSS